MPVSIRLGPELEERLTRASRKLRLSKTEVVKRSLEAYLPQIEPGRTPYELGKDLFGADDGREATLSPRLKRRLKVGLRVQEADSLRCLLAKGEADVAAGRTRSAQKAVGALRRATRIPRRRRQA